jgi:hypothetical protein
MHPLEPVKNSVKKEIKMNVQPHFKLMENLVNGLMMMEMEDLVVAKKKK